MDLKDQRFGIETEMTGVTRQTVAEVTAQYFGASVRYLGTHYNTYTTIDSQERQWEFMSDGSITPQRKAGECKVIADNAYKIEMVSSICRYEDIVTIQQIICKLKEAGAITDSNCGIHVHTDASPFDVRTPRNVISIMAAKEDLTYKALKVFVSREHSYCRKVGQRFLNDLNARKPCFMAEVGRIWYDGEGRSYSHYDDNRYHCLNLHGVFQKEAMEFRLFNETLHAGKVKAHTQFCLTIGAQALNQRRASRRKTQTTNEKYTFRTWPLRLGLNGDEFATARQHLLANLPGCIAWRDPVQAEAQKGRLRQEREEEREQILRQSEERQEEIMEPEEAEQAEAEAPVFTMSM